MTDVNFLISPPAITESPAVESFVYKYTNVILAFPHVYQGQNLSQMSQYVDVKYIFLYGIKIRRRFIVSVMLLFVMLTRPN